MHQLQQLHAELHVAQAAGTKFEFSLGNTCRNILLDLATHGLCVSDEVRLARGLPDEGRHRIDVFLPELPISRDRPCLEKGLELPGAGPPFVIAHVGRNRSDQGPLLTLWPQRRVDFPDAALGGGCRTCAHESGRKVGGHTHLRIIDRIGDENDIHVAHVVQLSCPAFAHSDHSESTCIMIRTNGRASNGQCSFENRVREVRQPCRDRLEWRHSGEISCCYPQQLSSIRDPQCIKLGGARSRRHRDEYARVGPHCGDNGITHRPRRRGLSQAVIVGEDLPRVDVPGEEITERLRHAEYIDKPATEHLIGDQRRRESTPLFVVACRSKTIKHEQGLIGIGGRAQICQQILIIFANAVQQQGGESVPGDHTLGARDVDEAQAREATGVRLQAIDHAFARRRTRSAQAWDMGRQARMRSGSAASIAAFACCALTPDRCSASSLDSEAHSAKVA